MAENYEKKWENANKMGKAYQNGKMLTKYGNVNRWENVIKNGEM